MGRPMREMDYGRAIAAIRQLFEDDEDEIKAMVNVLFMMKGFQEVLDGALSGARKAARKTAMMTMWDSPLDMINQFKDSIQTVLRRRDLDAYNKIITVAHQCEVIAESPELNLEDRPTSADADMCRAWIAGANIRLRAYYAVQAGVTITDDTIVCFYDGERGDRWKGKGKGKGK